MNTTTTPDWLVAGAEVVVYSTGTVGTSPNPIRTTVKKVAGQSFTVAEDREPRFRIRTLDAERGSGWSTWHRRVVPVDSDDARRVLAEEHLRDLTSQADRLYDAWRGTRAAEARRALIEALQAIEEAGQP